MALYLDNNATTAIDPVVLDAMMPYMQGVFGNPSSVHRFGRLTRDALEQARVQVANLSGAQPGQVIFTSGGTEANNLAIKGYLASQIPARLAVSAVEHASLLEAARTMSKTGWVIDEIAVDDNGQVTESSLNQSLYENTALISIMLANNETGVIQDFERLGLMSKKHNAVVHTDASQAAGKIPVNFSQLGVNMMTLSSHKMYGPQGVGALIVDRAIELQPIQQGGGQERGLRSGTENIAGIVGFGMAAELAAKSITDRANVQMIMRDDLVQALTELSQITLFATDVERLPNTVQFSVAGIDGETLLMQLDRKGIAVSSGSACHSGQSEPSHVLMAMGVDAKVAKSAIRVSFGKDSQAEDTATFMEALKNIIN
jgi:cysteine desulfurase